MCLLSKGLLLALSTQLECFRPSTTHTDTKSVPATSPRYKLGKNVAYVASWDAHFVTGALLKPVDVLGTKLELASQVYACFHALAAILT